MIVKADIKREHSLGFLFVIGGPGGSGSSTIAKLLDRRFSLRRVYGGQFMREYAKQKHMDLEDFLKYIDENNLEDEYDKKIDKALIRYAYQPNVLIESKVFAALATKYRIPCTVKIWIDSSIEVRTLRSFMKEGKSVDKGSQEFISTSENLVKRYELDKNRYKEIYNIDYSNQKLYNDIVVDSSHLNEHQTLSLIIKLIEDGGYTAK